MTGECDNDLRGVLFRNKRQREGKRDPDYQGRATVGGVDYWLDGWIDTPKSGGDRYLSLKFRPKDERPAAPVKAPTQEDFDDEIPF